MKSFRFVHAADLHLDSPFRGLSEVSPRLQETLYSATFQALGRIVDHAVETRSDFVILAGDLYDSRDRSLRALIEFRGQMERLAEHGIGVYVAHGNHDPLNGWGAEFGLPDNVSVFDGEVRTYSVVRRGQDIARISGVSYTTERVTANLARSFRSTDGADVYSIAVLHANVGHQSGHADYAPASITDLVETGFDYWALGHVHTRSVLSREPHIVYPGNPQGRHAREAGPRGCFDVEVSETGVATLRFVEADVVRWSNHDFSIAGHTKMESLIAEMQGEAQRIAKRFDGVTVLRSRLVGRGPLHADLRRDGVAEDLARELERFVAVESLGVATGPEIDRAELIRSEPVVGDFLRLVEQARGDAAYREHLVESLAPLFGRRDIPPPEAARIVEWIEKAGSLGADLLLDL